MKLHIAGALMCAALLSCNSKAENQLPKNDQVSISGTWKLLQGRVIKQGDTTITDYTQGREAFKMLNETHFSFFQHDLEQGKDSSTAIFMSGAGRYTLEGSRYTEYLDYCTYRPAENNHFEFDIIIKGDTLIQSGYEKLESEEFGVHNTETYVKVSAQANL